MATESHLANDYLAQILEGRDAEEIRQRLSPSKEPLAPRIPGSARIDALAIEKRWKRLPKNDDALTELERGTEREQAAVYKKNIENYIGTIQLPVGVAGPLRVNGLHAQGDYYIPLATTEAALVASYSRGAQLISEAGGCAAVTLSEGVGRSPGFAFSNVVDAGLFAQWVLTRLDEIREVAESKTNHGRFSQLRTTIEGNHVYLHFEMKTGDAAGQNMVTIAINAVCAYIAEHCPVKADYSFIEANMSGDKKATFQSFNSVRGKKVTSEVVIPEALIERRLHTSVERMIDYWRMSALGGVLSGAIGVQGHYANGLAALFIATGQDAACVSEASVGVTRFEMARDGGLYACVTMPNLIVGTVGGGTGLPTQKACLDLLGLAGAGNARALAEVAAGLALAGELSIIGALSAGEFARAHQKLARGKQATT